MYGPIQHIKAAFAPAFLASFYMAASLGQAPAWPAPKPSVSTETAELQAAVEEFKIATRVLGYRADSPTKTSASGMKLSSYHGRVYENFRNDILDAVPHEIAQNGGTKDLLRRNQFGFNLSGSVFLPKFYDGSRRTFFSLNFEGVRERIGRSYLRTVPQLEERVGDFTRVVDASGALLPIYDPHTTQSNPNYDATQPVSTSNLEYTRSAYPNRIIPASQIDPVSRRIAAYIPAPDTAVGPFFQNNYFVVSPETNQANGGIAKIDHSFNENHRLSVGGSYTNGFAGSAHYIDNAADPGAPDKDYSNRRITVEHVYTLSPGSVNTATLDIDTDVSQNTSGSLDPASALGLTGLSAQVFPRITLGGYLPLGRHSGNARSAHNVFTYTDAHSLKIGKHSLSFAGQFKRNQINPYQPSSPAGTYYFGSGFTDLPGITGTGSEFGSFLLGAVEWGEINKVTAPSYFRTSKYVLAATDTWEPMSGLTISLAATFETTSPRVEKYNRQSTVDLHAINPENGLPGAVIFAGLNGAPSSFQPYISRLDPSISLAWSPNGNRKSVVRASYSRLYQEPQLYASQWGTQGFNATQTLNAQNGETAPAFFLRQGVPAAAPLPDLKSTTANGTNAALFERTGKTPIYQSSSLSYEREVPFQVIFSGGLVTAWGHNLFVSSYAANPNAISPDNLKYGVKLNDLTFRNSLRPYPQYLDFDLSTLWPAGNYRRNSAWLRLEKRSSGGLTVSATYEFSRQWDDYSGPYGKQDFFNSHNEWSLSPWNVPQRLALNLSYDLPIGTNKPFMNYRDWRRHLVDGWSISDITTIQAGAPIALRALYNNTGGVLNTLRADVVPGIDPHAAHQGPDLWFNPAAFTQPADFTLGNASRTISILNPGLQNHDLSLARRFAIDQDRTVEFTVSAFNCLNHGIWNDPDPVIGSISSPNANAGHIIGSRGGRVVQLGLRLSF